MESTESFDVADKPRQWLYLCSDGAYEMRSGRAVWAWVAYDQDGVELARQSGSIEPQSPNRGSTEAECAAFDAALAWAAARGDHAVMCTDCQYVVKYAHESGATRRRRFPRAIVRQVSRDRVQEAHRMCRDLLVPRVKPDLVPA